MGFWSKLAKGAMIGGAGLATAFTGGAAAPLLGAAIGAATKGAANNRGVQVDANLAQEQVRQQQLAREQSDKQFGITHNLNAEQQLFNEMVAREQGQRASGKDALRSLLQAEYIKNKTGYTPKAGLMDYGFGPKASTAIEKEGAQGLEGELIARLRDGYSVPVPTAPAPYVPSTGVAPYTIDPKLLKPSVWEQIGNIAGPALSAYGSFQSGKKA